MYRETAKLLLYSNLGEDSILLRLSEIYRDWEARSCDKPQLIHRIYAEIKRLLDLSTQYGFNENLWQNYLTFVLLTNENSFSLTAERVGAGDGSVNHFAKNDFAIFRRLLHFDFAPLEQDLGIDCFSTITNYHALVKLEKHYYRAVSEKVQSLSRRLAKARDEHEIFTLVTDFYRAYGVGMFGLNRAFRIQNNGRGVEFLPINNTDKVMLHDLIGYELQKKQLVENTEAFVKGRPANNVLLYGDAGTGKSSTIKAVANELYPEGLRIIEVRKDQLGFIPGLLDELAENPLCFILFIDDLSFLSDDDDFNGLKAVLEGSVSARSRNVVVYATSNRRHIVRERFEDREGGEVHRNDAMQEMISLSDRFGLHILFSRPDKKTYLSIVAKLCHSAGLDPDSPDIQAEAERFALMRGGRSARLARQFVDSLIAGQG